MCCMLSEFSYELTRRTILYLQDQEALRTLALTLLESNKHQTTLINTWIYGHESKNHPIERGEQ